LLYTFDDREQILDLLERVTGSRLTYCYYRFGGVCNDVDDEFLKGALEVVKRMRERLKMYDSLVTKNIILMKRIEGLGMIPADMCRRYGASGPVLRGAGVAYDVRKAEPYSVYSRFDFDIPVFPEGDSMARYKVRMEEMVQSTRIIEQAVAAIPAGPFMNEKAPRSLKPAKGDFYQAVEAARGSFGVRLVSDGSNQAYRLKLRSPSFSNLSVLAEVAEGMLLADFLAMMGSLDLVIPEIDR
jgi:NADH-quinone oxidoreductase subunit D